MTAAERIALKQQYPQHYFVRVIALQHEAIIAIPIREPEPVLPGGLNLSLLHGATIRLGDTLPLHG